MIGIYTQSPGEQLSGTGVISASGENYAQVVARIGMVWIQLQGGPKGGFGLPFLTEILQHDTEIVVQLDRGRSLAVSVLSAVACSQALSRSLAMSVFECVHPLTQAIVDFLEAHPSAAVKKLDESKHAETAESIPFGHHTARVWAEFEGSSFRITVDFD